MENGLAELAGFSYACVSWNSFNGICKLLSCFGFALYVKVKISERLTRSYHSDQLSTVQ